MCHQRGRWIPHGVTTIPPVDGMIPRSNVLENIGVTGTIFLPRCYVLSGVVHVTLVFGTTHRFAEA